MNKALLMQKKAVDGLHPVGGILNNFGCRKERVGFPFVQTHFFMTENRNICGLYWCSLQIFYIFEKRNVGFELQKLFFPLTFAIIWK